MKLSALLVGVLLLAAVVFATTEDEFPSVDVADVEAPVDVDLTTEAVEVEACREERTFNQNCFNQCRTTRRCENRRTRRAQERCLNNCRDRCTTVTVVGNCDGSSSGDPHDRTFVGKLNNVYGVEGHHTLLKLGSSEVWTKIGFTPIWKDRAVNLEVNVTDGKNKCFLDNKGGASGNICGKRYGHQYNISLKTGKGNVAIRAIWSSLAAQQKQYAARCKQDKRYCVPDGWWTVHVFAPGAVATECTGSLCGGGEDNKLLCEKAKKLPHIGKKQLNECKEYEKNCERYYECLYDASHGLECEAKKAHALRERNTCENQCTATHNTHQRKCDADHNTRVKKCNENRTNARNACSKTFGEAGKKCTATYNTCVGNANTRHNNRIKSYSAARERCVTANRNQAAAVGNRWCDYSTTTSAAKSNCQKNVANASNAYGSRVCTPAYSKSVAASNTTRNNEIAKCKTSKATCDKNATGTRDACFKRADVSRDNCVNTSAKTQKSCKEGGLRTHGYCRTSCYNKHRGPSC
jgi:hypothetical protein